MQKGFTNVANFLSQYKKIVISTHESPDGDGLGAEIAFRELLADLGKDAIILNSDPVPAIFEFIDPEHEIIVASNLPQLPADIGERVLVVLDTNDLDNIGSIYPVLRDVVRDTFIIDHHEGEPDMIERNCVKVDASSVCEIIFDLIRFFGKEVSPKAAQALFAGILYDTGSFRYPKTTAWTYQIASHLVERGANPFTIYEQIYESNSLSNFELKNEIISTMQVLHGGKMIAMKLTPEMLRKTGASFTEGEGAINMPLTVKGVVASILVKQDIGSSTVKVSMRSKGDINVAEIALRNGGGGHKNAAGYKSPLPFDETYEMALQNMGELFRE